MRDKAGERITLLRKKLELKQTEFSAELGLKNSTISAIELGKNPLTEANIRLIALTFDVRQEWLREGTGDMMDEEALLTGREKRLLELFRQLSPVAQGMVIEYAEKLRSDEAGLRGEAPPGIRAAASQTETEKRATG
jgi:transcriptional regulator with XRE-family HTH domain